MRRRRLGKATSLTSGADKGSLHLYENAWSPGMQGPSRTSFMAMPENAELHDHGT